LKLAQQQQQQQLSTASKYKPAITLFQTNNKISTPTDAISINTSNGSLLAVDHPKVVIFSQARGLGCVGDRGTTYLSYPTYQQSLLSFGSSLGEWCEEYGRRTGQRVALVLSGHLANAHRAQNSCQSQCGCPPAAAAFESRLFDRLMVRWTQTLEPSLLTHAMVGRTPRPDGAVKVNDSLQEEILGLNDTQKKTLERLATFHTCGYSGAVVAHGALSAIVAPSTGHKTAMMSARDTQRLMLNKWERRVFEYQCPAASGMMVALFVRKL